MRILNILVLFFMSWLLTPSAHADPTWSNECRQNGGTHSCHNAFVSAEPYWQHNQYGDKTKYPSEQAAKDAYLKVFPNLCSSKWTLNAPGYTTRDVGLSRAEYGLEDVLLRITSGSYVVDIKFSNECSSHNVEVGIQISKIVEMTCVGWGFHLASNSPGIYYCDNPNPDENFGICPAGECQNLDVGEMSCKGVGNPVDSASGNKMQREIDYVGSGTNLLQFIRYYNSAINVPGSLIGPRWRTNFDRSLVFKKLADGSLRIIAFRSDGKSVFLDEKNNAWYSSATSIAISKTSPGSTLSAASWVLTDIDDTQERYDAAGKLIEIRQRSGQTQKVFYDEANRLSKVEDQYGRALIFTYDDKGRLSTLKDPTANIYTYQYNQSGMLESVLRPGFPATVSRKYIYDDSDSPYRLTGIENEKGIRFATWQYDLVGRAYWSEHAGGVEKYLLDFGPDSTMVTDPLGTSRNYNFKAVNGSTRLVGVDQPGGAGCAAASNHVEFDENGNPSSRTDFNGVVTTFVYDTTRNLERLRVEAANTASARTTTTDWHSSYRLPVRMAEPKRLTTLSYYPNGDLESITYQSTEDLTGAQGFSAKPVGNVLKSVYTYDDARMLKSAYVPRIDGKQIVNESYTWTNGNLATITNAVGHVITFGDYNLHGQPQTIKEPNGVVSTVAYYPRGQVKSMTQQAGGQTRLTSYSYEPTGALSRVLFPDGTSITYEYDDAERLISVKDNIGNKISYGLDNLGNRIEEKVTDPDETLQRQLTRNYDVLGRVQKITKGDQ